MPTAKTNPRQIDKYANVLTEKVTMSAANTLTYEEVNIGLSIFDKVGILISRIEYHPETLAIEEMTTASDDVTMAVVTSNTPTTLSLTDPSVVHLMNIQRHDMGTAGNAVLFKTPLVADFANLPGGGILITPRPWYVAMSSNGLANARATTFRFFFTVVKLADAEYFELLETRHYFG